MMRRAGNVRSLGACAVLLVLLGGFAGGSQAASRTGAVAAWQAPEYWTEIGTVRSWMDIDTKFYRIREESQFLNESQYKVDQVKEYAKTRKYRGHFEGIGLNQWQALCIDEQQQRRAAAQGELQFFIDFRRRLLDQVQNTRDGLPSGWGAEISDRRVVGIGLGKLGTAVGLDPSNPYAWHLYSYFSSLVGDHYRALKALDGARAALAIIPADQLRPLRADVELDRAWLLRDQGEFAAAQISLETAGAHGARSLEARLLQGLLAAQLGNDKLAITIAGELRGTSVKNFPTNVRNAGFSPEYRNVGAWNKKSSNYLHDWIMAYTWLRVGKLNLASAAFGGHNLDDQRPFANRFWNEAGAIYEVTGRRKMASLAWDQARVYAPYYPYLVYKSYSRDLGKLTGRSGKVPYLLGFDSGFMNGNRIAYGAALVEAVAAADSEQKKRALASRALDELEVCQRLGLYAGQASVLQGQVYYLMGDMSSALVEIEEALAHMDAVGDKAGFAAVLNGLSKARNDLAAQDIAQFYGQSGASRGRWQADDDPAATLAALRVAHGAEASDDNRRNLARFMIRNGQVAQGRELALAPMGAGAMDIDNIVDLGAGDVELILEADRIEGETRLAEKMVQTIEAGLEDPWRNASVWTLAGFICLDNGLETAGRTALERAAKLDPGNHGLKIQLSLM